MEISSSDESDESLESSVSTTTENVSQNPIQENFAETKKFQVESDLVNIRKGQNLVTKPPKNPAANVKIDSTKTKARNLRQQTNSENGKSYEDFSNIMDGCGDLLDNLDPDNPDSEVDKVVKFILDQNILVRHLNELCRYTVCSGKAFYKSIKDFKLVKIGRFTQGEFGEDALLRQRWDELIKKVPINDPEKCIGDFMAIRKNSRKALRKKNVLGCFLGQDLKHVRHAADVFKHSCDIISETVSGKFSKEEDEEILQEVKKSGANDLTWKKLASMLQRKRSDIIRRRYKRLIEEKSFSRGQFTLVEDEIILETLFEGKKDTSVNEIESIVFNELESCVERLNRSKLNISHRWNSNLKPILLAYHRGMLHTLWRRDFFSYLVEKKVIGTKDLNHAEIKLLFPNQTTSSIHLIVKNTVKDKALTKPLFQAIQEILPRLKDPQETERVKNKREAIVRIYEEIKNRKVLPSHN